MNPVAIAFAVAVPLAFALGVVFSKFIFSEAIALKQHVSEVESRIQLSIEHAKDVVRGDVASLGKAAKKL